MRKAFQLMPQCARICTGLRRLAFREHTVLSVERSNSFVFWLGDTGPVRPDVSHRSRIVRHTQTFDWLFNTTPNHSEARFTSVLDALDILSELIAHRGIEVTLHIQVGIVRWPPNFSRPFRPRRHVCYQTVFDMIGSLTSNRKWCMEIVHSWKVFYDSYLMDTTGRSGRILVIA